MDAPSFELTLLPGARALLERHARELPQRDELCGAFCAALALHAAGFEQRGGEPLDQDAVALAAGSVISETPDTDSLPFGERGRRDYRVSLPLTHDSMRSGTTAPGLVDAIEQLAGAELVAIPYGGPWSGRALDGLFDLARGFANPVTLVANHATGHLWGTHPRADQLLDYLLDGELEGPPPDWRVGHFACVVGRVDGPGGALYALADTYPALGNGGVHLQPRERLAAALNRREPPAGQDNRTRAADSTRAPVAMPAQKATANGAERPGGGIIVVASALDAQTLRAGAQALGLGEGAWDNGTVTAELPR
jgi:hypothetical protein